MKRSNDELASWMTKAEACTALDLSAKSVENLARENQIHQAKYRRPAGGQRIVVYNPEDVRRVAKERNVGPRPYLMPSQAQPEATNGSHALAVAPAPPDGLHAILGGILEALRAPAAPPTFLTLKEASATSGLSVAYLRRAIDDKSLPAVRDVGWRIRRRDLDAL